MTDLFSRLAERALGIALTVQPMVASLYAPEPQQVEDDLLEVPVDEALGAQNPAPTMSQHVLAPTTGQTQVPIVPPVAPHTPLAALPETRHAQLLPSAPSSAAKPTLASVTSSSSEDLPPVPEEETQTILQPYPVIQRDAQPHDALAGQHIKTMSTAAIQHTHHNYTHTTTSTIPQNAAQPVTPTIEQGHDYREVPSPPMHNESQETTTGSSDKKEALLPHIPTIEQRYGHREVASAPMHNESQEITTESGDKREALLPHIPTIEQRHGHREVASAPMHNESQEITTESGDKREALLPHIPTIEQRHEYREILSSPAHNESQESSTGSSSKRSALLPHTPTIEQRGEYREIPSPPIHNESQESPTGLGDKREKLPSHTPRSIQNVPGNRKSNYVNPMDEQNEHSTHTAHTMHSTHTTQKIQNIQSAQTIKEAPSSPTIQVTIGRIEVRATTTPTPNALPQRQQVGPPVMSLDDYLNQRAKGGR
jgi:hypothetical protein